MAALEPGYELRLLRKIEGLRDDVEKLQELQAVAKREHEQAALAWDAERRKIHDEARLLREKVEQAEARAQNGQDVAVQTMPEASTSVSMSTAVIVVASPKTPKTKSSPRDAHVACERLKKDLQKEILDLKNKLSLSQQEVARLERTLDEGTYWSPTRGLRRRGDETPLSAPSPCDGDYIDSRPSSARDTSPTMEGDDEPESTKGKDTSEHSEHRGAQDEEDKDEDEDEDEDEASERKSDSKSEDEDEDDDYACEDCSEDEPGRRRSKRLRMMRRIYYGRSDVESAAPSVEAQTPAARESLEVEEEVPNEDEETASLDGFLVGDDEVEYERSSRRTRKRKLSVCEDEDAETGLVHKSPSRYLESSTDALQDASDADEEEEEDEGEVMEEKCLPCQESGFNCIRISSRKACRSCSLRKRACELPPTLSNLLSLEAPDDLRGW